MIIFQHTETPMTDIYTLRSWARYWGFLALLLGLPILWIVFVSYPGIYSALILLWWLFLFIFIVDTLPMWWKRTMCGLRGKKLVASGNGFRGNARLEIEK